MKKTVRSYLTFTRGEKNATLCIGVCMCLVTCMPFFKLLIPEKSDKDYTALLSQLINQPVSANQQTEAAPETQKKFGPYDAISTNSRVADNLKIEQPTSLFNPDTVSIEQWQLWGVPASVALRMQKYVAKGGHLQSTDDLKKIFGFPEDRVDIIGAFISPKESTPTTQELKPTEIRQPYTGPSIELNASTEAQLITAGFTSNEAKRIVRFRDQAGGFFQIEQLYAIFGVDAAHIQEVEPWLQINEKMVILINLNTVDSATLAAHVYISDELAGEIIQYRKTTGKFYSVKEITKVKGMYPALFEKIKPYLRI